MAGARIEIEVDDAAVMAVLGRAQARLEPAGVETLLDDIGEYLLRSTRERAALEVDPDGRPWRPLEKEYARWKAKQRPGAPILVFDFHMLGDQLSHQVDGDTLYVGTNAKYGAVHQFAGDPPRAWLGISRFSGDEDEIRQITLDYLQAALDDG